MRAVGAPLRRAWRPGHALVTIPLALILVVVAVDIAAPRDVHLGPLLVAAPAITASFGGARLVGLIGGLAVAAQVIIGFVRGGVDTLNHEVQIVALVLISAFIVIFCRVRERSQRELSQVRSVAEAAQAVLLRPLPRRVGPLRLASVYLGAEAEAQIGGDLYAVGRTEDSTRLIIGDVRGKGLAAIGDAATLLGAFREVAHRPIPLPDLAAHLERSVSRDLTELAEGELHVGEGFVTATVLEIPDDAPEARLINFGHPPPLLLRRGTVTEVEVSEPAPPLGLGELTGNTYHVGVCSYDFGDVLLLYTDGAIDARNPQGDFYPLTDRVETWADAHPEKLLHGLRDDLLAFVGGSLGDDAAMIAVEHLGPRHHGHP
ncbi:PP2C family protein-serine/threonine phosphatase [Streptomyces sp. KR80]|uniref:PP2C family protein-serine/threonine phosphatase n=1 Tax=Streptomyces sp. KR80 TaxID=3457426 RepID=UPI003FD4CF42